MAKKNIPTHVNEDEDLILIGAIDMEEKYLVDMDDFITMNEVMNQWQTLVHRSGNRRRRFNTAFDALKEFLRVDKESGFYEIVKVDLSQMQEIRNTAPERITVINIRNVPATIGKLTNLQELNLTYTAIYEIPRAILLGCKHLKVLNLSFTPLLWRLPDEIGNLSELEELYLGNSGIKSVPDYVIWGKLQKLETLDLSGLLKLELKEHAAFDNGKAKLANLRKLNLRNSTLLKRSPTLTPLWKNSVFRRYFMSSDLLCDIDLGGADDLTSLPDVVGDLIMLKRLGLSSTDIASLPPASSNFYDKLVHLKVLNFKSTPLLRKYPQEIKNATSKGAKTLPLHDLVLGSRCPLLGCIGQQPYQTDLSSFHQKLRHVLARNRARFNMTTMWKQCAPCETEGGEGLGGRHGFPRALWPMILANRAAYLFRPYQECNDGNCDCQRPVKNLDAVFDLLLAFGSDQIFGRPIAKDEAVDSNSYC